MKHRIYISEIIKYHETPDAYLFFRKIEDWCSENIKNSNWKFIGYGRLTLSGIDVPAVIEFKNLEDLSYFLDRFGWHLTKTQDINKV